MCGIRKMCMHFVNHQNLLSKQPSFVKLLQQNNTKNLGTAAVGGSHHTINIMHNLANDNPLFNEAILHGLWSVEMLAYALKIILFSFFNENRKRFVSFGKSHSNKHPPTAILVYPEERVSRRKRNVNYVYLKLVLMLSFSALYGARCCAIRALCMLV